VGSNSANIKIKAIEAILTVDEDINEGTDTNEGAEVVADNSKDKEENGFFSTITGAVIGGGAGTWSAVGVFIVLVLGTFGIISFRKKKLKKSRK